MDIDLNLENISISPEYLEKIQNDNPNLKISDAVFAILEAAILTSVLEPGSKLKINKIAEDLAVSGTPVREAVEKLLEHGLVIESCLSGGKYKNYYVFDIEEAEINELFEARESIEATATSLCAKRNWNVNFDALELYANKFDEAMNNYINKETDVLDTSYDRKFHNQIVNDSGNKYLIEMYQQLDKKLNYLTIRSVEYMKSVDRNDNFHTLSNQHASIIYGIRMGFPQLARQAMESHIQFCASHCIHNKYAYDSKKN